jgi:hypothetical protein
MVMNGRVANAIGQHAPNDRLLGRPRGGSQSFERCVCFFVDLDAKLLHGASIRLRGGPYA